MTLGQDTASLYSRLSRWYDIMALPERGIRRRALAGLGARPGEAVLEVGFGTGDSLLALARAVGPPGRVCGVDAAPGMVAVARRKLERAGLAGRMELACGRVPPLPYPEAVFDAAFMSFVLETLEDAGIARLLHECRRVLRPGGRLAAVALARVARPGWMARLYAWASRTLPGWIDCRPIPLEELLVAAGVRVVRAERRSLFGLPISVAWGAVGGGGAGDLDRSSAV